MRRSKGKAPRTYWKKDDLERLATLYPLRPTAEIAALLGRSARAVYAMSFQLSLAKSEQFLNSDESGRLRKGSTRPESVRTQFQKGSIPYNKGLRRPGWHAGRMKETQFKPGTRSGMAAKNWVPIGTIRADGDGYLRIKVREWRPGEATGFGNTKVWPLYNRYTWEQHNGPIPAKHLVAFKDGNRQNCAIENLELLSMAENARRNSMWRRFPRELAESISLLGALKRKVRSLYGKEQNERPS